MANEQLVEAVAQAMFDATDEDEIKWADLVDDRDESLKEDFREMARAAIRVIRETGA